MSGRKPYVRTMSKTSWFLTHARFKSYMLHEVTSIFVALYTVLLIVGLFCLGSGPDSWAGWIAFVKNPLVVVLSLVALGFFVIHTMSWFKAVPQAMRVQTGDHFVPGNLIIGGHYAALGVFSLFVLILAGVA
jgi:succinate dehydrogenase subunit C